MKSKSVNNNKNVSVVCILIISVKYLFKEFCIKLNIVRTKFVSYSEFWLDSNLLFHDADPGSVSKLYGYWIHIPAGEDVNAAGVTTAVTGLDAEWMSEVRSLKARGVLSSLSPPPWGVGKFIKTVGEEYQVVKRGKWFCDCGEEYNVEKGKAI